MLPTHAVARSPQRDIEHENVFCLDVGCRSLVCLAFARLGRYAIGSARASLACPGLVSPGNHRNVPASFGTGAELVGSDPQNILDSFAIRASSTSDPLWCPPLRPAQSFAFYRPFTKRTVKRLAVLFADSLGELSFGLNPGGRSSAYVSVLAKKRHPITMRVRVGGRVSCHGFLG